ncbi:MAG: hypothetical protein E6J91_45715 [Deltaproteobacteria bacterium]|nr:MAG: hypothetical protein E6J91_45715 [Deltaproteobacteria bacterium]
MSWPERYWLYNRETGEPWKSTDPPWLIEYVASDRTQAYETKKLQERVKKLEQERAVAHPGEERP